MKLVYIVGGIVVVLGWLAIGLLVAQGPQPEIVVPAETITTVGPLNLTNTLITAWIVMAFLVVVSLLATRSMKLIPSGLQNFIESVIAFLYGQVEDIAGAKNAPRFFMVIATFFLFIIASNWFGLFPIFNAIGKTEDVGFEVFHELSAADPEKLKLKDGVYEEDHKFAGTKMEKSGGMAIIKPGAKAIDFEVKAGMNPGQAMDSYTVFLAHAFAGLEASEEEIAQPAAELVRQAREALAAEEKAPKLLVVEGHGDGSAGEHGVASAALGDTVTGIDFSKSKRFALVIPFFRGVYSDLNNTLALGICSFLIVEFWGFQALGFGYLRKFFNFSSPIAAFVGLLELLSEFIRMISFAFRLFGNIFAGEVLVLMLTFLMPFLFVDIIYGLELFVGFIQAAVFALLTLVFATMAVEHHGDEEHHDGHDGGTADAHHIPGAAQAE
ncbi:MAG: hypothetical protein C0506_00130 [Anaerolinea sp.]|nr:hypothetical protein [Anaerolinea sp.]